MKNIYIFITAFLILGITSCKPEIEEFKPSGGDADFSKYLALGNSLTAGYADGALYKSGQENSYPAIIAQQLAGLGVGEFKQPLMPDNNGGFLGLGVEAKYVLGVVDGSLSPVRVGDPVNQLDDVAAQGPYQNLGVPGAKSFHLLAPGYGSLANLQLGLANPYYVRFATSETASVMADAMAQLPTFFSLWIGNNDVLGYATSGGDGTDSLTPVDGPPGVGFVQTYGALIATLTSGGAKGVVANLPYVSDIPFFTTVPFNAIDFTDQQATVDLLTAGYAAYNAAMDLMVGQFPGFTQDEADRRKISFNAGPGNAVVILDEYLTDLTGANPALVSMRQATEEDLLLLSTAGLLPTGAGTQTPLSDAAVLSKDEVEETKTRIDAFNGAILTLASDNNLAFVDANSIFAEFKTGMKFNGVGYSTTFVTGGLFSLDGVHANPRGYAIVANEFIKATNTTYNASIPLVDVNVYDGVIFP